MPNPYIKPSLNFNGTPADPDDVLFKTHPDWASTLNSAPMINNVISTSTPSAPGANQPLTVTGGNASTSNSVTDANRRVVGQVPGTSISIKIPA